MEAIKFITYTFGHIDQSDHNTAAIDRLAHFHVVYTMECKILSAWPPKSSDDVQGSSSPKPPQVDTSTLFVTVNQCTKDQIEPSKYRHNILIRGPLIVMVHDFGHLHLARNSNPNTLILSQLIS
jgi:hypothetical protein